MLAETSFYEDPLTIFVTGMILVILFFWYFATDIERRKRNVGTVLLIGMTALCVLAATPVKERLKGGIDIVGGSSFTLRVQPRESDSGEKMEVTPQQVEQAILVIEKRLNGMGKSEPLIARQGADGILVQMPGVEPETSAKIRETLEKVAMLELREVSRRNDEPGDDGKPLAERVQNGSEIIPGYKAYTLKGKDEDGNEYTRPILLNRRMALGGSDIADAVPSPQQADAVSITLNAEGTDKMIALTKNMRSGLDRIAIVLCSYIVISATLGGPCFPLFGHFRLVGPYRPVPWHGLIWARTGTAPDCS